MKKKILTILIFNFALLAVFLEITGQLFKRYDFLKDYKSTNKEELILIKNKNYLNYVNHFRDFNYRSKGYDFKFNVKPINFDDDSIYIFSCYGICKGNLRNYDLLVQGDSWGEGLDRNINHMVANFKQKNIISAGTTSFSPSNFEGQLGYFKNIDYNINTIVVIIDQTDILDEYLRYKKVVVPGIGNKSSVVKPFNAWQHYSFYNYNHNYNFKSGFLFVLNKFHRKTNLKNSVRYKDAQNILINGDKNAIDYFENRLKSYINYVKVNTNTKNLILVTHDHYQHLNGEYKVSTNESVSSVTNNFDRGKLNIKHIHINPLQKGFCQKDDCSDYFVPGDIGSHPRNKSYKMIGSEIKKEIFN